YFGALDGARPGDHGQPTTSDPYGPRGRPSHLHHGILRMELTAGQLERLEDRQHLFHAGNGSQRLDLKLALLADHTDDRPQLPLADMRSISQFLDTLQDMINLFRSGVGTDDDNHSR